MRHLSRFIPPGTPLPPKATAPEPSPQSAPLDAVHVLLRLLFHHNRNQHGRAHWWRWLSILKRTTGKLIAEIDWLEALEFGVCMHSDEEQEKACRSRLTDIVAYLCGVAVPQAYQYTSHFLNIQGSQTNLKLSRSFTTVTADTQFAALGLVLISCLAQLNTAVHKAAEDTRIPILIESSSTYKDNPRTTSTQVGNKGRQGEDLGAVVVRDINAAEGQHIQAEIQLEAAIKSDRNNSRGRKRVAREETEMEPKSKSVSKSEANSDQEPERESKLKPEKEKTTKLKARSRSKIESESPIPVPDSESAPEQKRAKNVSKKTTKPTKRRKNAIDDIFAGL